MFRRGQDDLATLVQTDFTDYSFRTTVQLEIGGDGGRLNKRTERQTDKQKGTKCCYKLTRLPKKIEPP